MTLTLYNTLTRRKEPFQPIDPANVRMYVCGPTVYDFAHIGNARPIIVFDVLFRLLRHVYGAEHVTYARNITDVDDKINARAVERYPDLPPTEAIAKLTRETTEQFHKDIAALGVLPPTVEPRATDHIKEMRELCEALVAKGHAYVAEEHVLFSVASMADYGKLANRSLDEMEAGARVDVAPYKRGSMDFVLWKPSKPGEPAWPSPCGIATSGRPGWHIECSAMSDRWLWQEPQLKGLLSEAGLKQPHVFDIHGGGIDLAFPHHENEIAQSRCGHDTHAMANYWMHNGFLQVEGEKMSKSLGNFITINELLETDKFGGTEWAGEVLRWAMLMTHYREPINWSVDRLKEARAELSKWSRATLGRDEVADELSAGWKKPDDELITSLLDDLNLAGVRTRLNAISSSAERGDQSAKRNLASSLGWLGVFRPHFADLYNLGSASGWDVRPDLIEKFRPVLIRAKAITLNRYRWPTSDPSARETSRRQVEERINSLEPQMNIDGVAFELREHGDLDLVPARQDAERGLEFSQKIDELIAARLEARKRKDFKESDRIRDELAAMGIALKDSKNPQTGEIETAWEVRASGTTEVKR